MSREGTLTANEMQALSAWKDADVGYGFGFKVAQRRSKLPEHLVRRTVRALARKGMVAFEHALWDECEGTLMGAGYTLTEAGRIALAEGRTPSAT